MSMRLRKDKRHWRAPAKARSCLTLPAPSWNDRRPFAAESHPTERWAASPLKECPLVGLEPAIPGSVGRCLIH